MPHLLKQQYTAIHTSYVLTALMAALCTFAGWGCSAEYNNPEKTEEFRFSDEIVPVRYMEIKNQDLQATDYFHSYEIPAIRIQSSGSVEGLLIIESETQKIVRGENMELRPGKLFYLPLLNLSPGDYIAYIRGRGVVRNTFCRFTILDD